jgi:aspartate racemase
MSSSLSCVIQAGHDRPMVGILGGMGPLATAHFYRVLIERTAATTDQEHLPVAIWADPSVPDRTRALLGLGPSPVPALLEGLRWLRSAGAACVAMPCNTAHAFRIELTRLSGVEIMDMVAGALLDARKRDPAVRRVGVLATSGTRHARLYEAAAAALDLEVLHVSAESQRHLVEPAIAAVKGGERADAARWIASAAQELRDSGAEVAVAGCTEIPLVASEAAEILPVIDPMVSLADAVIERLWVPAAAPAM